MKPPEPPIFVWEPNDLAVFESVKAAEQCLEAIDVEDGVYKAAYDARGLLLKLLVVEKPRRFLKDGKAVHIEAAEEHPTHMADLETVARTFLKATGGYSEEWLSNATTKQLIEAAAMRAKTQ